MGSNRVGKIYIELDLDKSRFMRAQQTLVKEAATGAKVLEKNFSNLGIKSGATFDLMRNQAVQSFEAIKRSGKATADDLVRAEKAKAAKIQQLNEQQYGRQITSMDQIRDHWKGVTLAMAAATAAMAAASIYAFTKVMGESVKLANIQEASEARLAAVINATGRAAGYNIDQMKSMASALQGVTTVGDEVILNGMAILATFKNIRGEAFERTTKAALDMSAVMQQGVKSSMVMISKAMNDPIANLSAMTRAGVQFTTTQKDMIKQLWETGDMMGAQNIILKELESQFGGTAAAMRDTFGGATTAAGNAIGDLKEEIGFLITKNESFVELMKQVESWAVELTAEIKNNKQAFIDLASQGLVAFVKGAETAILAIGFLIEGMRNISMVWLTTKQAFLAVEIQAQKLKLWANEGEVSEQKIRKELTATVSAYNDVVQALNATREANMNTNDAVFKIAAAFRELGTTLENTKTVGNSLQSDFEGINSELGDLNDTVKDTAKDVGQLAKESAQAAKDVEHLEKAFEALRKTVLKAENERAWGIQGLRDGVMASDEAMAKMERDFGIYMANVQADVNKTENEFKSLIDEIQGSFSGDIFGDSMDQGLNNAMNSLTNLIKMYEGLADILIRQESLQECINVKIAERDELIAKGDAGDITKEETERIAELHEEIVAGGKKAEQAQLESISVQAAAWGQMFGALKGMYEKDTTEYKIFAAAQMAATVAQIAVQAMLAVVAQGQGDPYTAWARIAAMAALMVGLVASVGGTFNGSAAGGSEPAEQTASTVLGAEAGTASESISNSYEMLEEFHAEEYNALLDIYEEIQDLNQNITGLVTAIIKGDMQGFGGGVTAFDSPMGTRFDDFASGIMDNIIFKVINLIGFGMLDLLSGFVSDLVGWAVGKVFGGGGWEDVWGGVMPGASTIGDLVAGEQLEGQSYTGHHRHTEGGLFHSDTEEWWYEYEALGEDINALFTKIYANIASSFVTLAEGFGIGFDAIKDYVIDVGMIDLTNLSADEINEKLSAVFANLTDQMAEDLFGDIIKKYQQVGEGLYETAVRLVMEKEIFLNVMELTGVAFNGTAQEAVALSQSVIAVAGDLEALADAAEAYYEAFFSEAEQQAKSYEYLSEYMAWYNIQLPETRDGFRALVESIDITTEKGQALYVALINIAEVSDDYYKTIEDGTQTIIDAQRELSGTETSGQEQDIRDRYGLSFAGPITEEWINGLSEAFKSNDAKTIQQWAEDLGVTTEIFVEDIMWLIDMYVAKMAELDDIRNKQAEILGKDVDVFSYASRYNIDYESIDVDYAQRVIDQFLSMSAEEAKAWAISLGMSTSEFLQYISMFNSMIDTAGDEIISFISRLKGIVESLNDAMNPKTSVDIMAEINAIRAIDPENMTEENITDLESLIALWYSLAVQEAELWEQVASTIESLLASIESTIESIKYSDLNRHPYQKTVDVQEDYNRLFQAALTGGESEIQAFTSFVQTYLQTMMGQFGSSEKYLEAYEQALKDLEMLRGLVSSEDFAQKLYTEQVEANKKTSTDLEAINATASEIILWLESIITSLENGLVIRGTAEAEPEEQTTYTSFAEAFAATLYPIFNPPEAEKVAEAEADDMQLLRTEQETSNAQIMSNQELSNQTAQNLYNEQVNSNLQLVGGLNTIDSTLISSFGNLSNAVNSVVSAVNGLSFGTGYADGGIATGPNSGYLALLHGTEMITPISQVVPTQSAGNGDAQRPMNITIQIGNQKFDAYVDARADNVRVTANKSKGSATKRLYHAPAN